MVLYLLPVGTVPEPDLGEIRRFVTAELGFDTRRAEPIPIPEGAYDGARGQHDATAILRAALEACPRGAGRLLAVTNKDIFIPMLTFIYGQAQLDGTAALLSLARLRQEFHGFPPRHDLFVARMIKETLHELGHTFGLTHCVDPGCAMALSIHIADIDRKRGELCRSCALRLSERRSTIARETGANEE